MVLKVVNATELKEGNFVTIDGSAYNIRSIEISKTGKHGHPKCRFEAISVMDGKKKVLAVSGHERFEVPMVEKKKAQVLSVMGDMVSLMDLESFENLELPIPDELKADIKETANIEYWDIEGKKLIKRVLLWLIYKIN